MPFCKEPGVLPEEAYTYRKNIPLYMLRYQVRPGIIGLAQVNGLRGDPPSPARFAHGLRG